MFIPYAMVFVPIVEEDICWFYFLSRSPYQLEYVPNWLYNFKFYFRLFIDGVELTAGMYLSWILGSGRYQLSQRTMFRECRIIVANWWITTFARGALRFSLESTNDINYLHLIAESLDIYIVIARNTITATILFYYSIYLVREDYFGNQ